MEPFDIAETGWITGAFVRGSKSGKAYAQLMNHSFQTSIHELSPVAFARVKSAVDARTAAKFFGKSLPASEIARNDVLASVVYPDGGIVAYLVDRQSQVKQFTDQRLVIHTYSFDLLGRQTQDAVISLGSSSSSSSPSSSSSSGVPSGVDGTVQRIGRTYEVRGLLENITSYSSPIVGQGVVVNDVQRVYNSFEQLVTEYQEHSGAVNTSTSVNVQYQYADGSSNTIRPTALVYPNGRVLYYNYGISGGIDDALSRIASLIDNDGATHLADYTRIGASTFVEQSSPEPQIAWSLINGTGIDPYTGLDQFNRVIDNRWYSTADGTDLDRIQHGYDRASNRLWRKNTVAEAAGVYLDELYAYDGLYRLSEMQRGQLDGSNAAIVSGTLDFAQAWGLDATGNWQQFWQSDSGTSWDLQQSRTATKSNEIVSINGGGWAQPAYDAAGNMADLPNADTPSLSNRATFDPWNRTVAVWDSGSVIQQNTFDGLTRRLTSVAAGELRHSYHSVKWQEIEERLAASGAADRQFVWGPRYIDDLVARDRGVERLYQMQDANWNATAITDTTGTAVERYSYAAYGDPRFLTSGFSALTASSYDWQHLFAGYRLDKVTLFYDVRHRGLQFSLGCWSSVDRIRSGHNLYAYCSGRPVNAVDPFGLYPIAVCCGFDNGSEIWSETNWCDSAVMPGSCCAGRAAGWGWAAAWTVLAAHYNECGQCKWYIQVSGVGLRAAGNRCYQNLANAVGGHWNLVSSCHGEVWQGLGGPRTTMPWSMDPNLAFNQSVIGYLRCRKRGPTRVDDNYQLQWGSTGVKGKRCYQASDNDVADCVRHKPRQVGAWTIKNNCQTDVRDALRGCCLWCSGALTPEPH